MHGENFFLGAFAFIGRNRTFIDRIIFTRAVPQSFHLIPPLNKLIGSRISSSGFCPFMPISSPYAGLEACRHPTEDRHKCVWPHPNGNRLPLVLTKTGRYSPFPCALPGCHNSDLASPVHGLLSTGFERHRTELRVYTVIIRYVVAVITGVNGHKPDAAHP